MNITTPPQYIKPSDINRCGADMAIVLGQWRLLISRSWVLDWLQRSVMLECIVVKQLLMAA